MTFSLTRNNYLKLRIKHTYILKKNSISDVNSLCVAFIVKT